ncbi:MAG: c-type cytochrome [Acidimicrobiia bacterium]
MKRLVVLIMVGMSVLACAGRPAPDAGGSEIYLQLCSNCHGDRLQGRVGPALGAGSNAAGQTDEFLRIAITDGRGRMPSFASTLSEGQVDRLIEHLRQVQSQ